MNIKKHSVGEVQIAEVNSSELLIQGIEDALDLLGNLYYQGFDKVIIHQKNITADFFDLKNKMAGDFAKILYVSCSPRNCW